MFDCYTYGLFTISGITFFSIFLDSYFEKKWKEGIQNLIYLSFFGFLTIRMLKHFTIFFVLTVPIIIFILVLLSYLKNKK